MLASLPLTLLHMYILYRTKEVRILLEDDNDVCYMTCSNEIMKKVVSHTLKAVVVPRSLFGTFTLMWSCQDVFLTDLEFTIKQRWDSSEVKCQDLFPIIYWTIFSFFILMLYKLDSYQCNVCFFIYLSMFVCTMLYDQVSISRGLLTCLLYI